jgi:hypothetical protein
MSEQSFKQLEERLQAAKAAFPYPPTPDLAEVVGQKMTPKRAGHAPLRRMAWAALLLAMIGGLFASPSVRAAVRDLWQLGAVRIIPAPTPTVTPIATIPSTPTNAVLVATSTPLARTQPSLAGKTTFADAEREAGFPIRLPTYPDDLGPPDQVYLQQMGAPVVILVWQEPGVPEQTRITLHQLAPGTYAQKIGPEVIQETLVNGGPAFWTNGPYMLEYLDPQGHQYTDTARRIEGNVLIWTIGDITYRLESELSMEEAVRIAESVR